MFKIEKRITRQVRQTGKRGAMVTIPPEVLRHLDLKPTDTIEFKPGKNKITIVKVEEVENE